MSRLTSEPSEPRAAGGGAEAAFQAGADVMRRALATPFRVVELTFVDPETAGHPGETPAAAGQPALPSPEEGRGSDAVGSDRLDALVRRLDRVQAALDILLSQRTVRDWYGTDDLAQILGKAEFTIREWCRLGRIHAEKRQSGRGKHQGWVVSHSELQRIQREGLLPLRPKG